MWKSKSIGGIVLLTSVLMGCIETYDPPLDNRDVNYLVVDGFLNASNGTANIVLTRTLPVKSKEFIPAESGASVQIADSNGEVYSLTETNPGVYTGSIANVDAQIRYRLSIRTRNNREYSSEPIEVVESPVIDSISYWLDNNEVVFGVNSHDPTGKARYFRWKFIETYEYRSKYHSSFRFAGNDIELRTQEEFISTCWKSNPSTEILLGSTRHLSESVVSNNALLTIPFGSIKLSIKYRIFVQQQSLTEEAYNYWLNLRKSTENLGSLFDPLPSEVSGNIHSTTAPGENVIGYFSAGTIAETVRYVRRSELPKEATRNAGINPTCLIDTILTADIPNISHSTLLIDELFENGITPIGYSTSESICIDCRIHGGTTSRPPLWE
ncbi:MAG TPA: DUF4249 domain-containing protein [Chryseosolibacter sp.]